MSKKERLEGRAGTIAALGVGGTLAFGLVGFRFIYGSEVDVIDAGYSVFAQEDCKTSLEEGDSNPRTLFDMATNSPIQKEQPTPPKNKNEFNEYAQSQAEANGLTVIDNEDVISAINSAESIPDMLDVTNSYTSIGFGFKVEAPEGFNFNDLPNIYSPFKRNEFEEEKFRKIMKGLVKSIHSVPTEVIELANLDRLVITGNNSFDLIPDALAPDKSPGAVYYPPKDVIYIELNDNTKSAFQFQFDFSLSAAIDINVCGFAQSIQGENINPVEGDITLNSTQGIVDVENLTILRDEIKSINKKARTFRNYIAPRERIDLSSADQQEIDSVLLQVLRINEHVPGYANYWKSLTLQENKPSEEIIIDNTSDNSL